LHLAGDLCEGFQVVGDYNADHDVNYSGSEPEAQARGSLFVAPATLACAPGSGPCL
jgi:hypothetical protein